MVDYQTMSYSPNLTNQLDPRLDSSVLTNGIKIISTTLLGITYITQVKFILQGKGSPTGTMSCHVYNDSHSITATSSNTYDVSTVPTSATYYEFNFSSTAIADNYFIQIECSGITDDQHSVGLKSKADTNDETDTITFAYNTTTVNSSNAGVFISGTSSPSSSGVLLPPPVAHIRI
jgi:hypothetical protein